MEETRRGKFNPMVIVVGIAALVLIGGFMLISSNKSSDQSTAPSVKRQGEAEGDLKGTPRVSSNDFNTDVTNTKKISIEIDAGAFYFNPKEIRAKKGDELTIVIKSADLEHDFTIDGYRVKSARTKPGEEATVKFIAYKTGEFEYYCSVDQHRQNGQVGKLIVEE